MILCLSGFTQEHAEHTTVRCNWSHKWGVCIDGWLQHVHQAKFTQKTANIVASCRFNLALCTASQKMRVNFSTHFWNSFCLRILSAILTKI